MKNFSNISIFSLLVLLMFTACDFDADRPEYDAFVGYYDGKTTFGLYTPDHAVEQDNQWENNTHLFCADSLPSYYWVALDNENWMNIGFETADTLHFSFPFMTLSNNPRSIFSDGPLSVLVQTLQEATDLGYCSMDTLNTFIDKIQTIEETVFINDITMSSITTTELGNSITSYDREQNSFYVGFTLPETEIKYHSSLTDALEYIWPVLNRFKTEKMIGSKLFTSLEAIKNQAEVKTATDWSGYITASFANYHLAIEAHLEHSKEAFSPLAKALYGTDEQGNPKKEVWLTLYYEGYYDTQKNIDFFDSINND